MLSKRSTTLVLALVAVVLVGLAATMSWYLWWKPAAEPSAERPVAVSEVKRASAVAAAEEQVVAILNKDHATYDEQTAAALEFIVEDSEFATEYATTAEDVKADFLAEEVKIEYVVVGRSVVTASEEQVEALIFLNQFTTRGEAEPTITPYRTLVTLQASGTGWKVLRVDTK